MTNQPLTAAVRSHLVRDIAETKKVIAMGGVYVEQWSKHLPSKEARLAEFDRVNPDIDALLAMDKATIRTVSEEVFVVAEGALWSSPVAYELRAVFAAEVTRRKAVRTKADRAAKATALLAAGKPFIPGQSVEVHAFGHWYCGIVVRLTRTGSVVVEYTSGTGTTRQKTVGYDKVRALS